MDGTVGGERMSDAVPHGFGTVKMGSAGVSSCLMDISYHPCQVSSPCQPSLVDVVYRVCGEQRAIPPPPSRCDSGDRFCGWD